ncbi:hypothetical protein [Arsenicicoccus dermatophilus]|uniref:hypothetical protein n=1 Tax=Arsenicicoccus dermatophilus TaxID=1076331 RepID=UPI003916F92C
MRKHTTIVAGLVAAPLILGSVTACGEQKAGTTGSAAKLAGSNGQDAHARYQAAVDKTADTTKQRVTMRFDTSPENLATMVADLATSKNDKPLDPKIAKLITSSRVVVDTQSTGASLKDEKDPAKLRTRMSWKTDSDLVNLAMAAQSMFFKVDLAKIADQTGAFTMKQVTASASGMPGWMQDVIAGKWVGVDKATMDKLARSAPGAAAPGRPTEMSAQQRQQLTDAMNKNIDTNATFGGEGDDIAITLKAKPFVNTFLADMQRILPQQFPARSMTEMQGMAAKIKADSTLAMTATLADGKITSTKFDLGQIIGLVDESTVPAKDRARFSQLKAKNLSLPMVVEYSDLDGDVEAPAGARMITQADIDQMVGGLRRGMPTTPAAS